MSRKRSINSETLAVIKRKIENGVCDINAAADEYNVPVSTLYRSLRREFGTMPVHSCRLQDLALKEIEKHLETNGIDPENMSSHQKMLAIEIIVWWGLRSLNPRLYTYRAFSASIGRTGFSPFTPAVVGSSTTPRVNGLNASSTGARPRSR